VVPLNKNKEFLLVLKITLPAEKPVVVLNILASEILGTLINVLESN